MEKRYQIFVSSTYADLQEERQHVIQTLMEMDCIPAGMELFPAADEEQWQFIKRVIDDCDYYLLIIGGRYGSTAAEGISYTEKEYDYAIERGLKVIALLHENPDDIPVRKADTDPDMRERLDRFREKVSSNRLVRFWKKAEDLPGLVALSLSKTIKMYPAVGWVRANAVANEEILSELNQARKEAEALKVKVKEVSQISIPILNDLAGLDETYTIHGTHYLDGDFNRWSSKLTWRQIFAYVAPYLLEIPTDENVKDVLLNTLKERDELQGRFPSISDQDFRTVSIQLKALGLVDWTYSQKGSGAKGLHWSLTEQGERLMMETRTVQSKK